MDTIRALVIDDQDGFRELVVKRLTALGHVCMEAAHMEAAREQLAANTFSYIVLDMQIPAEYAGLADVGNGHLMLQEIRRTYGGRDVLPVIIVSGQIESTQDAADLLTEHEANDFVSKPLKCTGHTLEVAVERCLKAVQETHGLPAQQRPANLRPVAEWLRPHAEGCLTNWDVVARNGVVHSHVIKSISVLNTVLHCIRKNNDKPEGTGHGDFMDACGWSERDYFKELNGKYTPKRGRLKNYVGILKKDFGIDCVYTDHGVLFVQPQRQEVEQ